MKVNRKKRALEMPTFALTDSGNAEHIAWIFGERLRFNHQRGRWLLWNCERWTEDSDGEVVRMAKAAARSRLKNLSVEGDDDAHRKLVAWALQSESHGRLKAALELAKSTQPIADSGIGWDSAPLLLSVPNGVVDLSTGELRPANPEDKLTLHAAVVYDPAAQCPRFLRFLDEVFLQNEETIGFVQKAIGYSLTADVREQCLFLCYGDGANGKSTLLESMRDILGGYAHNLPFSALEKNGRSGIPNDIASLISKRFVTASETTENVILNEGRVKMLTGGDKVTGRYLYKEHFEFDPSAKFWLSFNHRPKVTDDSHGFWRRVRLIPFNAKFEGDDDDKTLPAQLKAEASGILTWAVQGCLRWQGEGLKAPTEVQRATSAYREESDPLAEFFRDRCEVCPSGIVESSRLRCAYDKWAAENGETPLDPRALAHRLRHRGLSECKKLIQDKQKRAWRGFRLKDENPALIRVNADTRTDADAIIQ